MDFFQYKNEQLYVEDLLVKQLAEEFGTPVLGADIGGIPELIDAGVNGELFESGNADVLTEKIRALWDDRTQLDAYTRACGTTRFDTVEEYAEKMMPLYQG